MKPPTPIEKGAKFRRRQAIPWKYAPLPETFLRWTGLLSKNEITLYLYVLSMTWGVSSNKHSAAIEQKTIAEAIGLSLRTTQRTIYRLEAHGLLRVTRRHRRAATYEIETPVAPTTFRPPAR